jgi:hypothetical protein
MAVGTYRCGLRQQVLVSWATAAAGLLPSCLTSLGTVAYITPKFIRKYYNNSKKREGERRRGRGGGGEGAKLCRFFISLEVILWYLIV